MPVFLQTATLPVLLLRLLLLMLALLWGKMAIGEPAAPEAGPEMAGANAVVRGIISYTRWPKPPEMLKLCIVGRAQLGEALRQPVDWFVAEDRLELIGLDVDAILSAGCNVVYVGHLADEVQMQALIRMITGEAILSIGEDEGFCSSGGMFCLERSVEGLRFAVNLDAITRSGLRVNPMVLRLSRQLLDEAQQR